MRTGSVLVVTALAFTGIVHAGVDSLAKSPVDESSPAVRSSLPDGMEFVTIPSGSFMMGAPPSESDRDIDQGQHRVTVGCFDLMTTEVTQGMWEQVMGSNPASDWGVGDDLPVYNVSWDDCQEFIERLDDLDPTHTYRLPTEAEWEYACRAGSTTAYYWGSAMNNSYCWCTGNAGSSVHQAGRKIANAWGLCDLSGNVWEWCQDVYARDYEDCPTDGSAYAGQGGSRIRRGGCWASDAQFCSSAYRDCFSPGASCNDMGFRLARSASVTCSFCGEAIQTVRPVAASSATGNSLPTMMEFVTIPSGEFVMGSPESESSRDRDENQHSVTIGSFDLMITEVTQGMWEEVMGSNPSYFTGDLNRPVERVCWEDCQEFIERLNDLDPTHTYRLPTEAEWEYACRAGSTTAYYWAGTGSGNYFWYKENSSDSSHPVVQRLPNAWGLYDMSGNVLEWCQDVYTFDHEDCPANGSAFTGQGSYRVVRGGCWNTYAQICRSAMRNPGAPGAHSNNLGLRLARTAN